MNRRLRLITLALIFTSVCVFLAWSDYRYPPFEPHPDGQRAEPPDFGSQDDLTKTPTEVSETPQAQITTSPAGLQPIASSNEVAYLPSPSLRVGDAKFLQAAPRYIQAIMDVGDDSFPRLSCPVPTSGRYEYLRNLVTPNAPETSKYFFALNLRRSVHLLPRLLGSIVEAMYFLGPGNCALSIVEGHSEDGTFEVLLMLSKEMERMRVKYFFESSDVNPEDGDGDHRISALAELRNQALQPLMENPALFSLDSMVFFINDVSLCMEDLLELLHQRICQKADMTCAMDWIFNGTSFYDVWISRGMNGDQFFEIPQSGSWDFAENLFWNDPETRELQDAKLPYQVFACWNGVTAFIAKPLLQGKIKFRSHYKNECLMGEPTYFCKDLWHIGHGKIAVVPSVNVGYDDDQSRIVKSHHGYVSTSVQQDNTKVRSALIDWKNKPPELIKCVPSYENTSWVPFDQALEQHDKLSAAIDGSLSRTHTM